MSISDGCFQLIGDEADYYAYLLPPTTPIVSGACMRDLHLQGTMTDYLDIILISIGIIPDMHFNGVIYVDAVIAFLDVAGGGISSSPSSSINVNSSLQSTTTTGSSHIVVLSVNDAPRVSIRTSSSAQSYDDDDDDDDADDDDTADVIYCREDGQRDCKFYVYVDDIDSNDLICMNKNKRFTMTLHSSIHESYIGLNNLGAIIVTSNATNSLNISLSAQVYNKNSLVFNLYYPVNYFGEGVITVELIDSGRCGWNTSLSPPLSSGTITAAVMVMSVNDPPMIAAESNHVTCNEDQLCAIPTVTIADADLSAMEQVLHVVISTSHGQLIIDSAGNPSSYAMEEASTSSSTLSTASEFSYEVSHNDSMIIIDSTNATLINQFITSLFFSPDIHFNGVWLQSGLREKLILDPDTDLASIVITAFDGIDSSSITIKISVSWVNDGPSIVGPSLISITDGDEQSLFTAFVLMDPDVGDVSNCSIISSSPSSLDMRLSLVASSGGLFRLPLRGSIMSGVRYDASHVMKASIMTVSGSLLSLQRVLQYIQYDGSLLTNITSSVTITLSDQGNVGSGSSALEAVVTIELSMMASLRTPRGFYLTSNGVSSLDSSSSSPLIEVNKHALVALPPVQIHALPYNAYTSSIINNTSSILQAIVLSDAAVGLVASTSATALYSTPLSRHFNLQVSSSSPSSASSSLYDDDDDDATIIATPTSYRIELDVPWRYEQQAIQIYLLANNDASPSIYLSSWPEGLVFDCELSFSAYGLTDRIFFTIEKSIEQIAANVESALLSLRTIGIYIHTFTHSYVHSLIFVQSYMHTYIHLHSFIHSFTHTYIHAYIHVCFILCI